MNVSKGQTAMVSSLSYTYSRTTGKEDSRSSTLATFSEVRKALIRYPTYLANSGALRGSSHPATLDLENTPDRGSTGVPALSRSHRVSSLTTHGTLSAAAGFPQVLYHRAS